MPRLILLGILCLTSSVTIAQRGSRMFFTLGPSLSVGNHFEGGGRMIEASDLTGRHRIEPLFSPLWGRPNPQYSGWQNFGRKIHFSLEYERFFSYRNSLRTGLEIGSRGYIIISEQSADLLVNYRNISIPLLYSRGSMRSRYWNLRKNIGLVANMASSIPRITASTIELKRHYTFYPTLYAGLELVHQSFQTPFAFEFSYYHGFYNVIQHNYLAFNYRESVPILSNGSALKLSVKYLIREKYQRVPAGVAVAPDKYDLLAYRFVKEPVVIAVPQDEAELCLFDDQTIDGDSVAIEFNNVIVYRDVPLNREGYCLKLKLVPGSDNLLVVHALNEGKIPPNTCVMNITVGDQKMSLHLKSDLKASAAIRFKR